MGSTRINKPVLKAFDKTVWLWSRIEALLPWPGLSLIMVARNAVGAEESPQSADATRQSVSPHA